METRVSISRSCGMMGDVGKLLRKVRRSGERRGRIPVMWKIEAVPAVNVVNSISGIQMKTRDPKQDGVTLKPGEAPALIDWVAVFREFLLERTAEAPFYGDRKGVAAAEFALKFRKALRAAPPDGPFLLEEDQKKAIQAAVEAAEYMPAISDSFVPFMVAVRDAKEVPVAEVPAPAAQA
jgi:hypothetical protein